MNRTVTTWIFTCLLSGILLLSGCENKSSQHKMASQTQNVSETTRSFQSAGIQERLPEVPEPAINEHPKKKQTPLFSGKKRKQKRQKTDFQSLNEWRSSLKEDVQTFRVIADEVIRIKGRQGTELFFPALSFADAEGNTVHGEIELRLKECYDFLSFFADGLTTITDQNELIETGGTIHLQAFQKGEELELLPDAAGAVLFPKNGENKPDMQTFYGETAEDDNIVWNTGDGSSSVTSAMIFPGTANPWSTQKSFVPRGSSRLRHTDVTTKKDNDVFARKVTWKLKDSESTLLKWFEETDLTDTALIRYFRHDGKRLITTLRFDKEGKVKRAGFGKKTPAHVAKAMENLLSQAPPVDIKKMGRYKPSSIYMLGLKGWTFNTAPPAAAIFAAGGMDSLTYTKLNETFHILSTNKMGWINCDRFYRDQRPKVEYAVTAPAETELMVLQFTRIRSQMYGSFAGDRWVFPNLPEGEPVKLVAIAMKDEQRLITVHSDKISSERQLLGEGQALSDDEFANVLK